MKRNLDESVELPEGVSAIVEGYVISITGSKGTVTREFPHPKVKIILENNVLLLCSQDATSREKKMIYTYRAHLRNMIKGATEGHLYKLKICSGHFPMNVAIQGNKFEIKNFLGEKNPRSLMIKEGADVKIDGDIITVEGITKERTGQTAADIESLTRIKNRDKRIFQDGIYLIEKDGKTI